VQAEVHWNYFLSIESDLERLSRFVEFDEANYDCFSVEISRLLIAAAAETDVVCGQICKTLNPSSTADNIHSYRDEITSTYPAITRLEVLAYRHGVRLNPWRDWELPNGVPTWWTAYNKLKHQRGTEYRLGSLKNVLEAVSGLFVVSLYLYKDKAGLGELVPSPSILRPSEDWFEGVSMGGYESGIVYRLD